MTRSFDVFFDLHLNKRSSKQSWGWWFETLSHPLWRHCNGYLNQRWSSLLAHISVLVFEKKKKNIPAKCWEFDSVFWKDYWWVTQFSKPKLLSPGPSHDALFRHNGFIWNFFDDRFTNNVTDMIFVSVPERYYFLWLNPWKNDFSPTLASAQQFWKLKLLQFLFINLSPLDKMAAISQKTFSDAFLWMKIFLFWLRFQWSLFPKGPIDNNQALV